MAILGADSRREVEVRRHPVLIYALVPLAALVLQAWLPRVLGPFALFDLPLVATIYFALGRRSPIQGMLTGGVLGLFEDALTGHAIGINGIAKTVAGFLAASVGARIDVDNHTIRMMLTFSLSLMCSGLYLFISRYLLGLETQNWNWIVELTKAVVNSTVAILLFPMLDRYQVRD
jgi:rod shape-determining protein MreD